MAEVAEEKGWDAGGLTKLVGKGQGWGHRPGQMGRGPGRTVGGSSPTLCSLHYSDYLQVNMPSYEMWTNSSGSLLSPSPPDISYQMNYFSWETPGIGKYLTSMTVQGFSFLFLLFLIETNLLWRLRTVVCGICKRRKWVSGTFRKTCVVVKWGPNSLLGLRYKWEMDLGSVVIWAQIGQARLELLSLGSLDPACWRAPIQQNSGLVGLGFFISLFPRSQFTK